MTGISAMPSCRAASTRAWPATRPPSSETRTGVVQPHFLTLAAIAAIFPSRLARARAHFVEPSRSLPRVCPRADPYTLAIGKTMMKDELLSCRFDEALNNGLIVTGEKYSHNPHRLLWARIEPEYFLGGRR
jgi:hypothetical protein